MSQGTSASTYLSTLLLMGALTGCATTPHESPLGVVKDHKGEPVKSTVVQPQSVAKKEPVVLSPATGPKAQVSADTLESKEADRKYSPAEEAFLTNFKKFLFIAAYANGSAYSPNADDPKAQEDMFTQAMKAYLHKLDPHSDYISPSEYKRMNERSAGGYGGIGIQLEEDSKTGVAMVIKPFDGTPAQRAGIKSGDRIIAVDGKMTETSEEAIKKMTGTVGTAVEVMVYRDGEKKPMKFNMVREVIEIKSVETAMLGDVGYLKLSTFSEEGVSKKVEDGIKKLKKDNSDIKGFVIDVRDNGGGLLTEGKKISGLFLNEGTEVVTLKDKTGKITQSYKAKGGDIAEGLPITVLTNEYSASASEIFAGAMKGNHRALIAGATTFGKGSVQDVFPLSQIFNDPTMEGAFKVTTQLFFMPNGHGGLMSNQGVGITPDIVYQPPKNAEQLGLIEVRKEAMMEGMIANPDGKKTAETTAQSFCTAAVGADLQAAALQKPLIDDEHKADYALICAVNALNEDSDLKNLTSITPIVPSVPPTAMNLTH